MAARDAHRAKEFYEAVLQVRFSSGHPGTWRTEEISPPLGIRSSRDAEPGVQLSYRVDDIAAAVERVRASGGRAGEPERQPYGLLAECADDQGATFRLWQPAGGPGLPSGTGRHWVPGLIDGQFRAVWEADGRQASPALIGDVPCDFRSLSRQLGQGRLDVIAHEVEPASADGRPRTSAKNARTFSACGENTTACIPVIMPRSYRIQADSSCRSSVACRSMIYLTG